MATKSASDVLKMAKDSKVQIVDVKFADLPGTWQHFSIPVEDLNETPFTEGLGFDGSSIRGFQKIQESDMMLVADPATAQIDPACTIPTLTLICTVVDPITRQPYSRDPRYIAQKAERYLRESGIADTSFWGPEAEFFLFNDVRYDNTPSGSYYFIDSEEAAWNTGEGNGKDGGSNLGHKIRHKEGYFPVPPADSLQDVRSEMVIEMRKVGVLAEMHHHEVATAGQCEIDIRFAPLVQMADNLMWYKYIIKNVARKYGLAATFMPKPLFGDNGSGMHVHQSLWKNEKPLFFDENGYAGLSEMARHYIGGILRHAPALLALCAPTTNSYRRLVPGFEAPVNLVYSQRNRSAAVRVPMYSRSPKTKRIEFRCPDPSCNPYLAFSAMLLAGLDGIRNKLEPPAAIDKDLYDLEPHEAEKVRSTPGSLAEVLDALQADHKFLLQGDVFTQDVIDTWIAYKTEKELDPVRLRPVPYEFYLYFDC